MKNFVEINRALVAKKRIVMMIMAVALLALPTMAQQAQWKSTSIMSGAAGYTAPITEVGATSAGQMATTTSSPAKAPGGPRKGFDLGGDTKPSEQSPIGDAVLPMTLMALLFGGYVALRRRVEAK